MSRPDVVEVLVDTDLSSMIKALWSRNPSEIRMSDGSVPTEEQRRLILSATALDLEAAKQAVRARTSTVDDFDDEDGLW